MSRQKTVVDHSDGEACAWGDFPRHVLGGDVQVGEGVLECFDARALRQPSGAQDFRDRLDFFFVYGDVAQGNFPSYHFGLPLFALASLLSVPIGALSTRRDADGRIE
jgi:hypothetical protein